MELQESQEKLRRSGLGLAAISYDTPAILKDFSTRRNITFPLLSDTGSQTIRAFGLLNESIAKNTAFYGIPHPGTFILNRAGLVQAKYFEEDYRQRYTAGEILVRHFRDAATGGETIDTKHLRLTSSATQQTVRFGQRLTLVLDVDLKKHMHVYAPGVPTSYIPISLTLAPSPSAKTHPAGYPPARTLHLKAINETVPVYERRFRILQDVTVTGQAAFTLDGTFRYQACDARLCYPPQNVPLRWSFGFEPLDRQRATTR